MPVLDLTDDEHAELVRLVRQAVEEDHFFLSPRAKRLRSILLNLNPAAIERQPCPIRLNRPGSQARRHRQAATPAEVMKNRRHAKAADSSLRLPGRDWVDDDAFPNAARESVLAILSVDNELPIRFYQNPARI